MAAPYQKALHESGYNYTRNYNSLPNAKPKSKKNRTRNITWFNPPWEFNVNTNIGKKFLNTVDKCFPTSHPLNKIFVRHTLKLSYLCMPNMKSIITSHNKNKLSNTTITPTHAELAEKECNCRNKQECPLEEKWLQTNVVYQATVTTETATETYVGLATNFKERYRSHKTSFRNAHKLKQTKLNSQSTFGNWNSLKKTFQIKWKILKNINRIIIPVRNVAYFLMRNS